ncbi:MAG: bifunctional shikimate kinase/3-dehydroquinate synthase [Thermoleophilaceae bacterium]
MAGGAEAGPGALVLVGFMGAGKSSAARTVAAELGGRPLDSDRELEAELGESIESFFDREGEVAFRAREEDVVLRLLRRADARAVALGGGSLESERVRDALGAHTVVHLEVDPDEAWRRAAGRGRPLARDRGRFDQLHGDRKAVYDTLAQAVLPPAGRDAVRHALPSLRALHAARTAGHTGVQMVWASARSGDYPVFFGEGGIGAMPIHPTDGRTFVVTDSDVVAHHRVAADHSIAVAAGEQSKTLGTAEHVLRDLAVAGAERGDLLTAVGGGVVGDLTGLCAALYQRGMRHVQVPTTLVAQVDSAYGGKTGVDLPEGKNYAGVYHQPAAVVCDPAALKTLPAAELAAGYAEVVKTALIAGGSLWSRVRAGGPVDAGTVFGCLRVKLAIVAADERDEGRRQLLNLGHTVAHAIESATGYARYRHGEAVAVGILAALRLSGRESLRAEVAELFAEHGLPVTFDGASVADVVALTDRDKKRSGGQTRFVLVESPGKVTTGHRIPEAALTEAVEEVHKP